ncbi:hypothetical protein BDAP_001521 [Binucleata daphniae]
MYNHNIHYIYSYIDHDLDFFNIVDDDNLPYYTFEAELGRLNETGTHQDVLANNAATGYNACYLTNHLKNTSQVIAEKRDGCKKYKCSFLNQNEPGVLSMKNICNFTKTVDEDTANTEELHRLATKKNKYERSSAVEKRVKSYLEKTKSNNNYKNTKINIGSNNEHKCPRFHQFQLNSKINQEDSTQDDGAQEDSAQEDSAQEDIAQEDSAQEDSIQYKQTTFDNTLYKNCKEVKQNVKDIFDNKMIILKETYSQMIDKLRKNLAKIYDVEYNKFGMQIEKELQKYNNNYDTTPDNENCEEYENICIAATQNILIRFINETKKTEIFDKVIDNASIKIWEYLMNNIAGNTDFVLKGIKLFDIDDFFVILKDNRESLRNSLFSLLENMNNELLLWIEKSSYCATDKFLLLQKLAEKFNESNTAIINICAKELNEKVYKTKDLITRTNAEIYSYFEMFFENIYNELSKIYNELKEKQVKETDKIVEEQFDKVITSFLGSIKN